MIKFQDIKNRPDWFSFDYYQTVCSLLKENQRQEAHDYLSTKSPDGPDYGNPFLINDLLDEIDKNDFPLVVGLLRNRLNVLTDLLPTIEELESDLEPNESVVVLDHSASKLKSEISQIEEAILLLTSQRN
jgi:hypothetical protein